jgi:HEAT repeat protein
MPEALNVERKALDLGTEILPVEGIETDEEILLARDLMAAFVKSVKAFRFYPSDNPTLKGFREQLLKKFQVFLNKYHSFVFQIGEYDFSYKGKTLYENRDVKSSIAFGLYKDGLRELRFMKGLEEWEIDGLMDIVRRTESINQLEDDSVTLLWEKDFIHISYQATDEFLEESPVAIPENIDQFRKNLVFKPISHEVEVDPSDQEADEFDLDRVLSIIGEEPPPFVSNRSVYALTPEEMEGLRKEVEFETDPTFVFSLVDILLDILALEKEEEPFQDATVHLSKVLDALLTLGEFQKAADLLKRLYILLKTHELKEWQAEAIRKLIVESGDETRVQRIGRILDTEERIRLEDVTEYLLLLQRNSIPSVIRVLGDLKNSKARRVLCDALAEIGKNAVDLFTPFIEDRRWYLVRNIVYILGRIGKEQSLPHLQKASTHEEARVRREAIQALGLIGGQKAVGLLIKALTDPDIRIRATAAINLGKAGKKAGLVPLLEVVQSKDFQKKEPVEIKAFFEAIGMIGASESVPVLQQLVDRKGWFSRGKLDDVRLGAIQALAAIGTPEAVAILDAGRNSKDEALREACGKALKSKGAKESPV